MFSEEEFLEKKNNKPPTIIAPTLLKFLSNPFPKNRNSTN
mgnify:CR=1 FL=1